MHRLCPIALAVTLACLLASPAAAYDRFVSQGPGKIVISGYDTTAYLDDRTAVRGTSQHSVQWQGVTWRFATAKDADQFRANPKQFAPQFGAYCTGGLSQNHVVMGNARIFRIHRGKVYLFAARAGARRFDRNPAGVIRAAADYAAKVGIKR